MQPNPLLMTVMGNPCHSGREYQANPFVLIDSQTNKIIRTWRGSMMDRKPWDWAADAARRLGRPVFVVAHPHVPKTFRAGIEVSPMFYYGGPYQEVHPDGSTSRGPAGGYKRNPSFFASMAGGMAGALVANTLSNPRGRLRPRGARVYCEVCGEWDPKKGPYRRPKVGPSKGRTVCDQCYRGWRSGRRAGESWAKNKSPKANPVGRRRKVTMSLQKFAEYIKKKGDPKLWNDFVRKVKGYQKWTHGSLPKNVTIEVIDSPGMSGLWIAYEAGTVPESAYIMPKGSKRKGAWKHPWDTPPKIIHDPEAGIIMHRLRGKSKMTDFYHK